MGVTFFAGKIKINLINLKWKFPIQPTGSIFLNGTKNILIYQLLKTNHTKTCLWVPLAIGYHCVADSVLLLQQVFCQPCTYSTGYAVNFLAGGIFPQ